jgi:hypothetical protein
MIVFDAMTVGSGFCGAVLIMTFILEPLGTHGRVPTEDPATPPERA